MYFTGLVSLRGAMFVDVQRCFKCLWWAYNHAGYVLQAVYDTLELSVASRTFLVAEIWLFEHASKTTCKKIENFGKILNGAVKTFFRTSPEHFLGYTRNSARNPEKKNCFTIWPDRQTQTTAKQTFFYMYRCIGNEEKFFSKKICFF